MAGPWEQYAQPAAPQQTGPAWATDLSRKDMGEVQMRMYQEGRKRLADLQAQIADGGSTMSALEDFGALNRKSSTGSLWQQFTPDIQAFRSPESMQMAAIQNRLAPKQRETGSGSSTDTDVRMFLRGLPSTDNEGPTNQGIRKDFQSQYDRAVAKANAMKAHLDQYGNLMDFDSQWAQRNAPPAAQAAPQIDSLVDKYRSKNNGIPR
jgi:hypothetical protein